MRRNVTRPSGMMVFTVLVCVILVGLLAAAYVYLLSTPDFVPPAEETDSAEILEEEETEEADDSALWSATMDDLVTYLADLGFIDPDDCNLMSTVGTENYIYSDIDMMWWDVDNLEEGTEEYDNWTALTEDGYIMLYDAVVYTPMRNGPFAIWVNTTYMGDTDAVYEAFMAFDGTLPD